MEDGDDESERRRIAIDLFKSRCELFSSVEDELINGEMILEISKRLLKLLQEYLKYLTYTHAETVVHVVKPLDKDRFLVEGNVTVKEYGGKEKCFTSCVTKCYSRVDKSKLIPGTRVTLERQSLIITRILPPEINPLVYNMLHQSPGDVSYSDIGGLSDQIKELRDWIELPLTNPAIFQLAGVKPSKGVLLYGPPGTGKTLLARAIAKNVRANFMAVSSSAIVDKYLGQSSLLVREMFRFARSHQPFIIFMDDIDAIGRRRGEARTNDCDRVLHVLLSQLDSLNPLELVKVIMATNRLDVIDPALLRHGRIDKKIEIPLPNQSSRLEILKIHASGLTKQGEIDYQYVAKLSEGFNGADMRNICTEAGMLALRENRDYIEPNDFIEAVRKLGEAKKLESSSQIQY